MKFAVFTFLFPLVLFVHTPSCVRQTGNPLPVSKDLAADPQVFISYLPAKVRESSGLIIYDGLFWTMNDSGGEPEIYGLHPRTGAIRRTIRLRDASNRDWEALAHDHAYIYVGDFGNNSGRRDDLCIYRIRKDAFGPEEMTTVNPETIHFHFSGQERTNGPVPDRSFDCEAMVAMNGNIYMFTKDWVNERTVLYRLPNEPGRHVAEAIDEFDARGLITDATLLEEKSLLVLLGYKNYGPFIWILQGFEGDDFFSGKATRVNFPSLFRVQTEGAYLKNADSLFISSEQTDIPPQLYLLKMKPLLRKTD